MGEQRPWGMLVVPVAALPPGSEVFHLAAAWSLMAVAWAVSLLYARWDLEDLELAGAA